MTDPAVGASTWASGSQVCRGNMGTLMANASPNARKSHNPAPAKAARLAASSSREKLPAAFAR